MAVKYKNRKGEIKSWSDHLVIKKDGTFQKRVKCYSDGMIYTIVK